MLAEGHALHARRRALLGNADVARHEKLVPYVLGHFPERLDVVGFPTVERMPHRSPVQRDRRRERYEADAAAAVQILHPLAHIGRHDIALDERVTENGDPDGPPAVLFEHRTVEMLHGRNLAAEILDRNERRRIDSRSLVPGAIVPGHRPVSRQIPYQLPYFRFGGLPSSGRVGSQRIGSGSRLDRPAFGQKRGIEIEIGFLQPGMLLLPDQVGQDIDPLHARPAHLKTGYQRHADRHDDDDQRDPESAARIIALLVHVLRICTGAKLINYIGQSTLPAAVSETNSTERRNEKACKRRSIRRKSPGPAAHEK